MQCEHREQNFGPICESARCSLSRLRAERKQKSEVIREQPALRERATLSFGLGRVCVARLCSFMWACLLATLTLQKALMLLYYYGGRSLARWLLLGRLLLLLSLIYSMRNYFMCPSGITHTEKKEKICVCVERWRFRRRQIYCGPIKRFASASLDFATVDAFWAAAAEF